MSHNFKNLMFNTRHARVSGLGNPEGSMKAMNMLFAIRTIQERTGRDLGATFLSGTTISNSLTELYLLFKYLRPKEMERQGIHLLEHKADTLRRNGEHIVIAGVRNPFDIGQNRQSPTLSLAPEDFVVLLTHTPDYAEDVPITNTDLVLAGHTHGGQVTVFGLYAPIIPSHYGQRFLTGLKYNSSNTPIIITNGIGTSNKNVRLFAPSEVVVITLLSRP